MNPQDAEEYTQALGQVVAGGWRQVALGQRLGVPQALGLSTSEWVEGRLGGYIRLSIPERREAVKELTAQGLSSRMAGDVLGVDQKTVLTDRHAEENASLAATDAERSEQVDEEYSSSTVAESVANGHFDMDDMPPLRPTRAERAYTVIGPLLAWVDTDPHDVAATCAPEDLEDKTEVIRGLVLWLAAIQGALEDRQKKPLSIITGGKADGRRA